MPRLKAKRAIVTGAASGIGRASARAFAAEGASVLCVDRAEAVHETAQMIEKAGGRALSMTADAGAETDVKTMIDKALAAFGGLDIVYANAGVVGPMEPITDQTPEAWMELLRINLIGPFLAIKYAAPVMIAAGRGSIVCTASVAGINANAGPPAYSASKAGVISLVKTSANELYGTGVRINAICPGLIETGITKPIFDAAKARGTHDKIGQLNPLRRYGQPEEIAAMALFLASDEASYVNGQAIAVDGGLTSTLPFAGRGGGSQIRALQAKK